MQFYMCVYTDGYQTCGINCHICLDEICGIKHATNVLYTLDVRCVCVFFLLCFTADLPLMAVILLPFSRCVKTTQVLLSSTLWCTEPISWQSSCPYFWWSTAFTKCIAIYCCLTESDRAMHRVEF